MTHNLASRVVFLTGGTGFIGRHFADRLGDTTSHRCKSLRRTSSTRSAMQSERIELVTGDLMEPSSYADALRGCDLVVHMAAVTGKARRRDYFSVNVEGTRALVEACAKAAVPRFVFLSSIAATYENRTSYYYADSKHQAEEIVRGSGLEYAIIRPTIVLGRDSPIWIKLRAIASLPVMPLFADGVVRVQPIHVDDVVAFLLSMIEKSTLPNRAVELGGPETVTFEEFLRKIRRLLRGHDSRIVHIPVTPIMNVLASVESWLYPILPVTAGQLSAFATDSVAANDPLVGEPSRRMMPIDGMLRTLIADA